MAVRIALASMAVTGTAVAVITVGVFVFASSSFEQLMVEHGSGVVDARAMFDQSIAGFFVLAATGGLAGSVLLAMLLARWLSGPLRRISGAAQRLAHGERAVRVIAEGPREIVSLAQSFNQLAARLDEQERMRSEFIANAAHELRTPLTNLLGYLEALRDGVVSATPEAFTSLGEEVDRLVRLSRSLDALAAGDHDDDVQLVDLDLREAIEMAVEFALPMFERRGIALTVRVPDGLRARPNRDDDGRVTRRHRPVAATRELPRIESTGRKPSCIAFSITPFARWRSPHSSLPRSALRRSSPTATPLARSTRSRTARAETAF